MYFPGQQCVLHSLLYKHHHHPFPSISLSKNESLYPLHSNFHSPLHPESGNHCNHYYTFCLYEFNYSTYLIFTIFLLLHLAYSTKHNTLEVHVLWYTIVFPSFLRLNDIPLYVDTTFCLFIHPSMTLGLLSPLGYCDCCPWEHGSADISFRAFKYFELLLGATISS